MSGGRSYRDIFKRPGMSAFPKSGRSDQQNLAVIKVRFRPEAAGQDFRTMICHKCSFHLLRHMIHKPECLCRKSMRCLSFLEQDSATIASRQFRFHFHDERSILYQAAHRPSDDNESLVAPNKFACSQVVLSSSWFATPQIPDASLVKPEAVHQPMSRSGYQRE